MGECFVDSIFGVLGMLNIYDVLLRVLFGCFGLCRFVSFIFYFYHVGMDGLKIYLYWEKGGGEEARKYSHVVLVHCLLESGFIA